MPHKILDYEVKYRPIKYPRIELRTGRIVVILPEGHDPDKVLRKHEKWNKDKLNIIADALSEAKRITLANRNRNDLREIVERLARNYERELSVKINKIFIRRMKTK
ncbi:hypothetical protein J7K27_08265, partial [Candidatus Bathyarchaeota archaeon]|nr:hypothetical protein [Candidatus Bathyarchaeota archaeon]